MEARGGRTFAVNTPRRGRFDGVRQIIQYNWSFYLAGLLAILVGLGLVRWAHLPTWIHVGLWLGIVLAGWWWVASLVASWWIYDLSELMSWTWLSRAIDAPSVRSWVNVHAGLDESTVALQSVWGSPHLVLDIFDATAMTEPSIHRARELAVNEVAPTVAGFRALPIVDGGVDLISVLFTAHELRAPTDRESFFGELNRILAAGGRLVIVEHVRDSANFGVFGPGFIHFMPDREWLRLAELGGFRVLQRVRKTPFVILYVFEKR